MPVDLSAPNSIIAAFAKGRQEAFERQQRIDALAQQKYANEFAQQQADEKKKEFETQLAQHDKEMQAQFDIARAAHKLEIAKAIPEFQKIAIQYGKAPNFSTTPLAGTPDYAQLLPQLDPQTGRPVTQQFYGDPNSEFKGQGFEVPTPEEANRLDAARLTALTAPKTKAEIEVKNAEATAKFNNEYILKQQDHLNNVLENYNKPTDVLLAQRIAEGKTARAILATDPNNAAAQVTARHGDEAQTAFDLLTKQKIAERPASEALIQKELQGKDIADAIISGLQPPDLSKLYGVSAFVRDELAKRKYDLTSATKDWSATQGWIKTLNGPKQIQLRQAVSGLSNSIPILKDLYSQWKEISNASEWKIANRANLELAKQRGGKAGAIATALEAQIVDMTSNLAQVYEVGNSPTDNALKLAAKNLGGAWGPETMDKALDLLDKNLGVRVNSILTTGPSGGSSSNPYAPAGTSPFGGAGGGPNVVEYDINGKRK